MALEPGVRLGTYEILSPLGAGGMGEVYRAQDTKLGRGVAIKVLPDALLSDRDHVARFEREARALAALHHPHIASLFGMEEAEGRHFLIMELVEGETLAERLARGPIALPHTLTLAQQIAEALEAAHEKGIVHRDLKPANIKITPDDKVKVLDFGLAKLGSNDPGEVSATTAPAAALTHSPTLSMMATQAGMILGTAAYMSPEQAKGLPADHRSDVFSFGSVLYEMLTGRAAFHGETAPEILASVLVREPDFAALPPNLNPRIPDLLRRCLEKNPKKRWQAVGDLRAEIETVAQAPQALGSVAAAPAPARPLWRRAMPVAAGVLLATALSSLAWWSVRPAIPTPVVARFRFSLGEGERFTDLFMPQVAVSRDGSQMVYVANRRLYLRAMSDVTARAIPGTESAGFIGGPIFSPDSRSLAFWVQAGRSPIEAQAAEGWILKRIALSGGAAVTICTASLPFGTSWDSTGIVFAQGLRGVERTVMRVSENGGKPEAIVRLKNDQLAQSPQMLPGGDAVLFTLVKGFSGESGSLTTELWDSARVVVQPLKGGEPTTVIENASDGRYLPSGYLTYALGANMLAVRFDVGRRKVIGGPVPVVEGISRPTSFGNGPGGLQASVSDTGALVFVPGPASGATQVTLVVVDRKGATEPLATPPASYAYPRVSPDGGRVAVEIDDARGVDVWIYDLTGKSAIRRLTTGGKNRFPVWAGNDLVVFQSDREGDRAVFWQRADGTKPAERLTKPDERTAHVPESASPDGRTLLYDSIASDGHSLWTLSLADRKPAAFGKVRTYRAAISSTFSPDGRWVAYAASDRPPNVQVFVAPFPPTGSDPHLIGDGTHPLWSRDGKELSYEWLGLIYTVPVLSKQPAFNVGPATSVPRTTLFRASQESNRDRLPDDRYVAVAAGDGALGAANTQIQVVLNWFEELKQRLPVDRR